MRRIAALLLLACGGGGTPAPATAPVAVTIASDAGARTSSDPGILIDGSDPVRLPDGTIVNDREDGCVEVQKWEGCNAVDTGEVEVLADKWLLYRDTDHRFRVRELKPRIVSSNGSRVTLAIGDRVQFGGLTIVWHGVARVTATNEAIVELRLRHPSTPIPLDGRFTKSRPTTQVRVPESHNVVDLELEKVNEDASEITFTATERDPTTKAGFGDTLGNGTYVFPDGLRITYRYAQECDFDTSSPCIYHHEIDASMGGTDKHLSITFKSPSANALGHHFKIVKEKLVVSVDTH